MRKMEFDPNTVELLFGNEAAERDDSERLKSFIFKGSIYQQITSGSPLKMLIGFKGTGKSALMRVAHDESEMRGKVAIWIRPDDLSETYDKIRSSSFVLAITQWKKALAKVIVEKIVDEYCGQTLEDEKAVLKWAFSDGYKSHSFFKQLVNDKIAMELLSGIESAHSSQKKKVLEEFIQKPEVLIFIDDLDRGWAATEEDQKVLSSLLNALGDLTSSMVGLTARIAFRTDVYLRIRASNESQDKFEGAEIWVNWTNHEILIMLVKRIGAFFGTPYPERELKALSQHELAEHLKPVFQEVFTGTKSWEGQYTHKVLMSLIRKRPRDLIKLCTFAANRAYLDSAERISGKQILSVLPDYSQGRVQDLIIEFKKELLTIEKLIYKMAPTTEELSTRHITNVYQFDTQRLIKKIENAMQNISVPPHFRAMDIARFLYMIGFITARKSLPNNFIERKYYDEKKDLLLPQIGDLGYSWEIHPSFRAGLSRDITHDWKSTVDFL